MIIWLASYPKSGNTWVRSFINSLIFTEDGSSNINHLKIGQFPNREHFINLISNLDTKNNLKELSKNWIIAQNIINLSVGKKFFKTHHSLCKIYGNNFTDLKNTDAVIHIVRDPRNVITSL